MLTGRAWKAGGEVHMHFPSNALESIGGYEEEGLGESPTGQRLPERTYDVWRESEAIPDWEACKAYLGDSIAFPNYLESWKGSEKAGWTRCRQRRPGRPYDKLESLES